MTMKMQFQLKLLIILGAVIAAYTVYFSAMAYQLATLDNAEAIRANIPVYRNMFIAITLACIAAAFLLSRQFCKPLTRLENTMKKISSGDLNARAAITSKDEFETIGNYLDSMLQDRITVLTRVEEENEQLNESILGLLETVSQLAQKNLAIKAKVNEDITGPLADALNMMATETTTVLNEVTRISGDVAETSNLVKSQSDNVLLLADKEQNEVEKAAVELKSATDAMARIASLAESSNKAATDAISTTLTAMSTVSNTVESINTIRDKIHETEKRIKRLGERSQEIGTAVNLINNISERTHILALNASMHAASAGEAGKGFAVVADEVQRLAENAKEATGEVGTLVNNIQVEAANTVNTMNELISQVVGGSQLAEEAGKQMEDTQATTAELVHMVQKIADSASKQSKASSQLKKRTDIIRDSVRKTGAHLKDQTHHTDELVEQAMQLVASVGVFKLANDELTVI